MSDEMVTFYVKGKIKKIFFPSLPLRMWMFHNGTNQSELMKERWKDPKFRKKRKKTYNFKPEYMERRRKAFTIYVNSEEGRRNLVLNGLKRRGKTRKIMSHQEKSMRLSPFFMIDGVEEEIVEMDRIDLSHGVVVEPQLVG